MSLKIRIIKLRDEMGWTQEELAERIGVSRSTVAKWESGRGTPTIGNIITLSEVFGVTIDSLLKK